jgi:hypothetical protein
MSNPIFPPTPCPCCGARAQAAQAVQLHQALTDPENQPNQHAVQFLMHGPKFAFKVGAQQFTLDYEPTEPGEFEVMRDMLIHAFSTFTPDVKDGQAVPLLTVEEIQAAWVEHGLDDCAVEDFAKAIEQAVRAKLGVAMPMPPEDWSVFNAGAEVASGLTWAEAWDYMTPSRIERGWTAVCVADKSNIGIVGKEDGNV